MIYQSALFILAALGLSLAAHARETETPAPVRIRAVLHNPAHPAADLFYTDQAGAVVPLDFRPQDLTGPLSMLPVNPGKITRVPSVRKVNDFHMAQTNFYYQHGQSWIPFAERQLQYVDACRRIFIIHATPGALQPTVTTIVDTITGVPPH